MLTQTIHVGDCELLERWIDLKIFAGESESGPTGVAGPTSKG
jgi:hypothetical protein